MANYSPAWVQLALHGAPGPGSEVTREVAEATGVRNLGRHARTLNAWAQLNPGRADSADYWKEYKAFAIALMREPHAPPVPPRPR